MKKYLLLVLTILFTFVPAPTSARAPVGGDESAPIQEKKIDYKNWTFESVADGKPVSLREAVAGKRLVLVVYFSPWCGNWRNEAPLVAKLYDKYKNQGFEVVAVSEYAPRDETKKFFGGNVSDPNIKPTFPYQVVVESDARTARESTTHCTYRRATGDTRNWGSPYNVFLEPAQFNPKGDVLVEKAFVANGELIEADAEKFIRERLKSKANN